MLINRRHLAVRFAASKDATRYMLNGVRFLPDGRTVATDGHMLLLADSPVEADDGDDAQLEPFTAELESVNRLVKALPKNAQQPNAQLDIGASNSNGAAVVNVPQDGTTLTLPKIDGDYPNWEQVMPDAGAVTCRFGISTLLLEKLCKAAREFCPEKKASDTIPIKLEVIDGQHAIKATVCNADGDELTGVLMPMRLE